ncbi:hypothetical protein FACUT_4669 [Fusarium acutatum]|uniref:Uncharacterized protein n=1 Tax=Fusarium acutatum TaxID=78861 RepID=A0A8H4NNS1_9HYPO|nr:hypothetical protein FACUT_4669 [Fusarium acutatum]
MRTRPPSYPSWKRTVWQDDPNHRSPQPRQWTKKNGRIVQHIPNCRSIAHQWRCIHVGDLIRDPEQEFLAPDCCLGKAALILIGLAIQLPFSAVLAIAAQTFITVATGTSPIAPSNTVAKFEVSHGRHQLLDDSRSFVPKVHICSEIVQICTAKA